ncbi:MAG: hypothetical protein K6E63_11815 [Lachnospiraceae bacterium]|nr:hypothetical protein [Lachnospiraceae bacterium]
MKRSFVRIMAGILCCILLTGCGGKKDSGLKDKLETVNSNAQEQLDNEGSKQEGQEQEEAIKWEEEEAETDIDKNESKAYDFAEAFKNNAVSNNGTYFVTIGDKVYFRNISPEAMEEGATFGEFLSTEWNPVECPLICYDLNTCEWEEVGKITGVGELYASPKGFYIGEMRPDSLDSYCTEFYDPATGKSEVYCKGMPRGISKSGELLAVERYGGENINMVLLKDGNDIVSLGGEDLYYEYVGFAGEDLITILHKGYDEFILCSVDGSGKVTELGSMGTPQGSNPEPKQLKNMDGDIYLCVGYYEGTGHFLADWKTIKATPGTEGSLTEVTDGMDTYEEEREYSEGPEGEVPKLCFDTGNSIFYSPHQPYVAYMGEGDNRNNLYYYNDIYEECLLVKDFIRNDYSDECQIVQEMASDMETVFVIYADAVTDTDYEIGWRTGYRMTGWHICAIPFGYGHEDENGLARDIIYFD